ncbi:hypothetical protein [Dolosigranulum savutiense]|uniref:Uncharacterized protein n=1 Tax=Dolosigranulum savutiense TaxID=3110288 RepID=A0AB74THC7_9LACT
MSLNSINGVLTTHAAGIPVIMVPDTVEPTDEVQGKALAILDSLAEVKQWLTQHHSIKS